MKFNKKHLIVGAILLFALLFLNKKPSIEEQLIGTWQGNGEAIIVFYEDGTAEDQEGNSFNWYIYNNTLYLKSNFGEYLDMSMPITSNELTYLEFTNKFWDIKDKFIKIAD